MNTNNKCTVCGGLGKVWVDKSSNPAKHDWKRVKCKHCSGTGIEPLVNQEGKVVVKELTDEDLQKYIPNAEYRNNNFNKTKLLRTLPLNRNAIDSSVKDAVSFMESYINNLSMGVLPTKSYFLNLPDDFGKKYFVTTAIKTALSAGFKPSPYVDLREVTKWLYANNTSESYENLENLVRNHDIIFVTTGGSPSQTTSIYAIRALLDLTNLYGKPMLMTSKIPDTFLINNDSANIFASNAVPNGVYGKFERKQLSKEAYMAYKEYMAVINGLSPQELLNKASVGSHNISSTKNKTEKFEADYDKINGKD